MTKDQLHGTIKVVNKKYGTEDIVLHHNVLMKDSAKGWIRAVIYVGPDRFSPTGEMKLFCKSEAEFLDEFDLPGTKPNIARTECLAKLHKSTMLKAMEIDYEKLCNDLRKLKGYDRQ